MNKSLICSAVALFRYHVVSLVLAHEQRGLSLTKAILDAAQQRHPNPDGGSRRVSGRTLHRWVRAYRTSGLAGLEPASRRRTTTSVVLSPELLDFVRSQRKLDEAASLPELIARAHELDVVPPGESVDRSTLWRACRRQSIPVHRRKRAKDRDSRRFAHAHRMQFVLCDGKHFRAGAARARRVVHFFLDDASRMGLTAVVGTSENAPLFLRGLHDTVRHHGLMDVLYDDHGSGFTADDSVAAVAQLGALLIHGEVAYPEGHGKVEKLNQFAKSSLLRQLDGRPDVDPDCGALELLIQHWLREVYNHRLHESLAGLSPWQRWQADDRPLRFPESDEALRRCFVVHEERRVSPDHVISFEGTAYQVPRGHAGKKATLQRHLLDGTLSIEHEGRLVILHPVDLVANAHDRRGRGTPKLDPPTAPLPPSAAEHSWRRNFAPLVGPDGGFPDDSSTRDSSTRDKETP